MRRERFTIPAALGAMCLLAACTPDKPSSGGTTPEVWTPAEVQKELGAFGKDLERILAVVEPLEGDWEALSRRVLEDDQFSLIVKGHVERIESVATTLRGMEPEERSACAEPIRTSLQSIELRMTEICSGGGAAADAFAPMFVAAQDALRSCL
jgi:hypothetical protein